VDHPLDPAIIQREPEIVTIALEDTGPPK